MINPVVWLDDDRRQLRIVKDLLCASKTEFVYVRSVLEGLARAVSMGRIQLLLLDAIVPLRISGEEVLHGLPADQMAAVEELLVEGADEPLEGRGLRFVRGCRSLEIPIGRIVVVSYVGEELLSGIGYVFDEYISKLDLPEALPRLREIVRAVQP